jgi:hypothetical protein
MMKWKSLLSTQLPAEEEGSSYCPVHPLVPPARLWLRRHPRCLVVLLVRCSPPSDLLYCRYGRCRTSIAPHPTSNSVLPPRPNLPLAVGLGPSSPASPDSTRVVGPPDSRGKEGVDGLCFPLPPLKIQKLPDTGVRKMSMRT